MFLVLTQRQNQSIGLKNKNYLKNFISMNLELAVRVVLLIFIFLKILNTYQAV